MGDNYYQPNQQVLDSLPNIIFVAVIGPTAAGKTTLLNAASACCPALHQVLSTTSRQPRPGEDNDVDFHFRSREDMLARIEAREFVTAIVNTNGEIYATAAEDYSPEGIATMSVLASAMPMFQALPFKAFRSIFILPPSWEVWEQRIKTHSFRPEELEKRMQEAAVSLRYAVENKDIIFVLNDDLSQSTLNFTQAALGAAPTADQAICRDLAAQLLEKLQK